MGLLTQIRERLRPARTEKSLGDLGEAVATRFLKRQGYIIVARSQRGKLGEVDVIAVDNRTIVFVEVKTRRSEDAGHPADAVHDDKQRRLTRLALSYLRRHDLLECKARFDVIAIVWPQGHRKPAKLEHFKNAFEAVGKGQMFS